VKKICLQYRRGDFRFKTAHMIASTAANVMAVTSQRHGLAVAELSVLLASACC